jgi:translation initiation factor 2 beta subunit (eIF-2beta)/eIF-5
MTSLYHSNKRMMIEHAARFEMEARTFEDDDPDEAERLRYLSHDAQHQVEHLRKQLGEDTSIRKTGDLVAEEIRRQEWEAITTVKCT